MLRRGLQIFAQKPKYLFTVQSSKPFLQNISIIIYSWPTFDSGNAMACCGETSTFCTEKTYQLRNPNTFSLCPILQTFFSNSFSQFLSLCICKTKILNAMLRVFNFLHRESITMGNPNTFSLYNPTNPFFPQNFSLVLIIMISQNKIPPFEKSKYTKSSVILPPYLIHTLESQI